MSNKEASVSARRSMMRSGNEDRSGDGLIPDIYGAGDCVDARALRSILESCTCNSSLV